MKSIVVPFLKAASTGLLAVALAPATGGLSIAAGIAGGVAAYNGIKCVGNIAREIIGEEVDEIFVTYFNFSDGALRFVGAVGNTIPDTPITDLVGYLGGLKFSHAIFRLVQKDYDFVIELTSSVYSEDQAEVLSKKYGIGSSGISSDSVGTWIYLYCYRAKGSANRDNALSKVCYGKKRSSVSLADIKKKAQEIFDNQRYDFTNNNCQDFAIRLAKWAS